MSLINKISEYRNRAHVTRRAHYLASTEADKRNLSLGIPVVIITALVGTSIFGTLSGNPDVRVKICAGLLSIGATLLSALQTYLGFGEKSLKHKEAGAKYAILWRAFDVLIIELQNRGDPFAQEAIIRLKEVVAMLDDAGEKSPSVPDRAYSIAKTELRAGLRGNEDSSRGAPD